MSSGPYRRTRLVLVGDRQVGDEEFDSHPAINSSGRLKIDFQIRSYAIASGGRFDACPRV